MALRFMNFLYGSTPVEFESAFGLDESVRRLCEATNRWFFSSLTRQAAAGKVSPEYVSLERAIPFVGNPFKPVFLGRFHESAGRVVLAGWFSMSWGIKVFMSIWFGGCAVWTLLSMVALVARDPNAWWFPFAGMGMMAAGYVLVRVCQWFARKDAAWLSAVIQSSLLNQAVSTSSSRPYD